MTSTTEKPKPKRRWHQFSLRTLLIVFVISTVAVGWIGGRVRQARLNRERADTSEKTTKKAVAAIERLGGTVTSAYEERRPQTWLEEQLDDPGSADDPVGVLKVTGVDLYSTGVTDAGLEHLKGLTSLQTLILTDTKVTDDGFKELQQALPSCKIFYP